MNRINKNEEYLKTLIDILPHQPGIYQFFDSQEQIIYIGKAKDLKKRVSSYFAKIHDSAKTRILVRRIADIKHMVVDTENDALLLENNLIKKYQPRYNIMLKDDKTFPWICIKREEFPRIFYTRSRENDNSEYFGPYTSVRMIRTILSFFKQLFNLRTCSYSLTADNISKRKFKVCLEYHIHNCKAPCIDEFSETDYQQQISAIRNILKGNINSVIKYVKELMTEKAEKFLFEEAHELKEKINLLESYQSKSTIVNPAIDNVDVFSITDDSNFAYVNYLRVINGAIIQTFILEIKKKLDETQAEILLAAITDIRLRFESGATEIIVPIDIEYEIKGVKITIPLRGDKKHLLELSEKNVKNYKAEKDIQRDKIDPQRHAKRILNKVKEDFRLAELPVHIECFDNSNLQGTNAVAACVVFRDAKPSKKDYRHFNIKTVQTINDFASMEEIVFRRYNRLINEGKTLPQLIIVDGGKGQLSAAVKSLEKLNIRGKVAIIGIAKRLEEIFFPNDSVPLYLDKNSESLKLVQNLRNEAHRFGIDFHRNKRSTDFIASELDNIQGLGEKTKIKLLEHFKSVKAIEIATLSELQPVVKTSKAKLIFDYFQNKNQI